MKQLSGKLFFYSEPELVALFGSELSRSNVNPKRMVLDNGFL